MGRAPKACGAALRNGCTNRVVGATYCTNCQPAPWSGGNPSTRADRKLAHQVLNEEPTCRDCGAPSTEAGHIIGRAQGGKYIRANLKGQCRPCNLRQMHEDKHAARAAHAP